MDESMDAITVNVAELFSNNDTSCPITRYFIKETEFFPLSASSLSGISTEQYVLNELELTMKPLEKGEYTFYVSALTASNQFAV